MKKGAFGLTLSIIFTWLVGVPYSLLSQGQLGVSSKVYALVIGISDYQNEGIDKLDFAHKDAEAFADYLKSNAGGAVPDSNIVLLQNEKATFAAIYNAWDWLLETCKENDLVYFYFSGHGDMENSTMYKLGFLISYNTPRSNYINNAVRIEDLNNYANTLSVKTKAKVILITDACHSGNLAGSDFKGNLLVGEQLKTIQNNEIRITSCAPDQLSVEDKKWGGGRGVFSYYLVNGLIGMADKEKDGTVSVKDISNYLQTSLSNDVVLKQKKHRQTPIIKGMDDFKLSKVDPTKVSALQNDVSPITAMEGDLPPLPPDPSAYFFYLIEGREPEKLFQFKLLSSLQPKDISLAMLDDTLFRNRMVPEKNMLDKLKQKLQSNPDALKRFNRKLVDILSTRGQDIINLYLSGDEQEMERRRYYNSVQNDYEVYAKMFEVAVKLADAKSPLSNILQIKYRYFSGVALRLQIPLAKDPLPLIEQALEFQNAALQLEENAAYIHNELGLLYKMKQNFAKAISSFTTATEIAPTWAIPWSNLSNIALRQKKYDEGLQNSWKAIERQGSYSAPYVNIGSIYEEQGNYLLAEEYLRKSIELNSRHYVPFERLGYVYMHTTQYSLADSFFHEAAIRKKGFNITEFTDAEGDGLPDALDKEPVLSCTIPTKINDKDGITYFVKGLILAEMGDTVKAEAAYRKCIEIDPANPLVYHYLGKIMWKQMRWQEVDVYLQKALQTYLAPESFTRFCDSAGKFITDQNPCIRKKWEKSYYNRGEDYFLLADAYEKWNHFSQAAELYEAFIKIDPAYSGAYYKLWRLYERMGRFEDAEEILMNHDTHCNGGKEQLNAFYERTTKALPTSGHWHYRAGCFQYRVVIRNFEQYSGELFRNQPDEAINSRRDNLEYQSPVILDLIPPIMGTNESMDLGMGISTPKRSAILYLLKADQYLTDTNLIADANEKIGNVFVALQAPQKAYPYFQKLVLCKVPMQALE
ncbi:MAG: caspase family protein [Bacteroidetes bacterium]|nr:caspase family protein [Bacteroidota bacterium]